MERAVDNSRHTLAVLTPAYVASDWTAFEGLLVGTIDPAARQRKLFPLLLTPCQLPRRIAALSYADFTKPQHHAAEFTRLLKQLQGTAAVADSSAEAALPTAPPAHPERVRPAQGGDSISNDDGGGATLGCLVVDRAVSRQVYILSDFNAMCNLHGPSYVGDAILQPGRVDGGSRATDVIATLSRWTMVHDDVGTAASNVSAAIAQVRNLAEVSPEIRGRGFLKGVRVAAEGTSVWLVGRTGGQVSGTVLRLGVQEKVPCSYHQIEGGVRSRGDGSNLFPILFGDLIECTYMLQPGDSGAILLDEQNYALGLGFAGSAETSLFIPLQKVLDALQVDLVTRRVWTSLPKARQRQRRLPPRA
jgi:hypothetical protein